MSVASATLLGVATLGAPPAAPHIVMVLVDDLGYNGVGWHNDELKMPITTALARDGLLLESYYTYKVCAPARASFLTGRYPYKLHATQTNFAYFWMLEGTNTYVGRHHPLSPSRSLSAHTTCLPPFVTPRLQ